MEERRMNHTFFKAAGMVLLAAAIILIIILCRAAGTETAARRDARMAWWREARFGLFIHWGLYSIPAGEWNGETGHAEWIRTTARIPIDVYDRFVGQFNPVRFNAEEWVRMAKDAGMKYIVITSKHHDGFCLFDSKYTDFDVMSTPFKRDIMKELSEAAHKEGIQICWYHSIMDWHHPDYLPRRDWETDRSAEGADFDRYVAHMKNQLEELVHHYGHIGVLWFDGEWENTWNHTYGNDLYDYVRGLETDIIINNRVGAGRSGMEGMNKEGEFAGDFGTPEQQIPATGLPGTDWETCMTMNDHWGYNKNDRNWKSATELVRMLIDIASKGGNFLLNVGPTAEGVFPDASIERLAAIGKWMKVNGEAIYGTGASPFMDLVWGRCTQKKNAGGTRLYLHVFDWPRDGMLRVPGIYNTLERAFLLSEPDQALSVERDEDALVITVPELPPDTVAAVVVLDVNGKPDVSHPPDIRAAYGIFVNETEVSFHSPRERVELHYTLDGSEPGPDSPLAENPVILRESALVSARCFRDGKPVSGTASRAFTRVAPQPAAAKVPLTQGLKYGYYEGNWDLLPDFASLKAVKEGVTGAFEFDPRNREEYFGFRYQGFIRIPEDGVYAFFLDSDDGSRLYLDDALLVDNNGLHGMQEKMGVAALAKGFHPICVTFFEKTGGDGLNVSFEGPGIEKQTISRTMLFHTP